MAPNPGPRPDRRAKPGGPSPTNKGPDNFTPVATLPLKQGANTVRRHEDGTWGVTHEPQPAESAKSEGALHLFQRGMSWSQIWNNEPNEEHPDPQEGPEKSHSQACWCQVGSGFRLALDGDYEWRALDATPNVTAEK